MLRGNPFGKVTPIAMRALRDAFGTAKSHGAMMVEVAHWLQVLFDDAETDCSAVMTQQGMDRVIFAHQLETQLQKIPRVGGPVDGFSEQVRTLVDDAEKLLLDCSGQEIRSGLLLLALLKSEGAVSQLVSQLPELRKVDLDWLRSRIVEGRLGSKEDKSPPEGDSREVSALGETSLAKYAVNLTELARSGRLDAVVGRDAEIRQLCDVLMRRRQNNPILVGEPGVGKTAVVEGLAQRIAAGDVPEVLRKVELLALDITLLQAGSGVRGEFEARLKKVIEEVQSSATPIILFVDEAHTLIGAGGAAGTGDAANILKPALARGALRTIAATTWSEYKKYFEGDPALTRRFQVVRVDEPSEEDAIVMLRTLSEELERHHKVEIADEAIVAAVRLSIRYLPSRHLPDKAVSLLDTACARVALAQGAEPEQIEKARRQLWRSREELRVAEAENVLGLDNREVRQTLTERIEEETCEISRLTEKLERERQVVSAVQEQRQRVRELVKTSVRDEVQLSLLRADLAKAKGQLAETQGEDALMPPYVDASIIADVLSAWTGIPVRRMVKDQIQGILALEDRLCARVIGQDHAQTAIANRIRVTKAGLDNPDKPIGVFMFAGPSGVGKTETALALADIMYGGDQSLITINMSEFQESHTVSTLKGAPPGYVGYEKGGVLTEAVRRRPYSVLLLDEVEKAHPDVHELFFQVFDKGWMEDGSGLRVDFKNTIILLTTNVGSNEIIDACKTARQPSEDLLVRIRPALRKTFPDALLGRMTVIPFYPLDDNLLTRLARMNFDKVGARLIKKTGASLSVGDDVYDLILQRCREVESGARLIQAIISNTILPEMSIRVLNAEMEGSPITSVSVFVEGKGIGCRVNYYAPVSALP